MKTGLVIAAIGGVFLLFILGGFFSYMGWSNDARKFEADIPSQYEQMQNTYDNGWKEVMEENQIGDKYADQFKNAFQAILQGNPNGNQQMVQVLTAMPNFDASLLKKVQESIERFHASFSASQQQIIALKQSYRQYIGATTMSRIYNSFGGYPHIKCGVPAGSQDDYQIVTSGKTQTDFKNHKADALDLSKH